jgi:putative oxidoreductase
MATAPSPREPLSAPAVPLVRHVTADDVGLLLLRVIVGIVFIYHGSGKLFGGLHGFAGALTGMNVPVPMLSATLSACTEFFGGIAMLLGFGVRIAAIPMVFNMLVAILLVHGKAFGLQHGGMEYPLTLGTVLLALGIMGAGRVSLAGLLQGRHRAAD